MTTKKKPLISVRIFRGFDFSDDSSSDFCSDCSCWKNYSLDSVVSSSVGSSLLNRAVEQGDGKVTVNSCTNAVVSASSASEAVATAISNTPGAERTRRRLLVRFGLHTLRVLVVVVVVVVVVSDICCLVDRELLGRPVTTEVPLGRIWRVEGIVKRPGVGEQC
jgi:hypothetical protein